MARLPRLRFSVIEIPPEGENGERGLPLLPQERPADQDPLLARLLIQCARRALASGPAVVDDAPGAEADEGVIRLRAQGNARNEMPPPLEESPGIAAPPQHQRWPRRDDAPRRPR